MFAIKGAVAEIIRSYETFPGILKDKGIVFNPGAIIRDLFVDAIFVVLCTKEM